MPLIDLKTNLKDLKFGHDGVDGSSSKEPFVRTKIPANNESSPSGLFGSATGGPDFLIRGGLLLPRAIVNDEVRLFKFFIDLESPRGLLFTLKQNILSRTNVKTQGTGGPLSSFLNQGLYTPLSTLLAAASSPLGIYPNKQGINPFAGASDKMKSFYAGAIANEISNDRNVLNLFKRSAGILSFGGSSNTVKFNNRLASLYSVKIINNASVANYEASQISYESSDEGGNADIIAYGGGPNSILGIGKTHLRFATDNVGSPLRTGYYNSLRISDSSFFFGPTKIIGTNEYLTKEGIYKPIPEARPIDNISRLLGASLKYGLTSTQNAGGPGDQIYFNQSTFTLNSPNSVSSSLATNEISLSPNNRTVTYTAKELRDVTDQASSTSNDPNSNHIGSGVVTGISNPGDFRALLRKRNPKVAKAPDYKTINLQSRKYVGFGDPGNMAKDTSDYAGPGAGYASKDSYDVLNAFNIYRKEKEDDPFPEDTKDLIPFRIGILDYNADSLETKTYIHFRAFLDQITDNYNSDWSATKYIGRGENFYTYNGFSREISLSWTVAAQSKFELMPMYRRLNYLASICAPDYNSAGYMRGNIVKLTVGGYFYEQYGIIKGLSYEMNSENDTWEIGINSTDGGPDNTVKALPHIIRVKSFNFIPIHSFTPRLQQIAPDKDPRKTQYGPERYIALQSDSDKYSSYGYGPVYYGPSDSQKVSGQNVEEAGEEETGEEETVSIA